MKWTRWPLLVTTLSQCDAMRAETCGPNRPSHKKWALLRRNLPCIRSLCRPMMFATVWTAIFSKCVWVLPRVRLINGTMRRLFLIRLPSMFGSQQEGRRKHFNIRRRKKAGDELADLCGACVCARTCVFVCVRVYARHPHSPYLVLAGVAGWNWASPAMLMPQSRAARSMFPGWS